MQLWQSIPFACIMLPLASAAVAAVLRPALARHWALLVTIAGTVLSALLVWRLTAFGAAYTYPMGHYPAPWGNEIRAGMLEAVLALLFHLILALSILGGWRQVDSHVNAGSQRLYAAVLLLMTAAMTAEIYTNDLFTAYVFVEIMTIAAAALIAARKTGAASLAATRYMIMNMIGSSLFLLGIVIQYSVTGHLLMSPIQEEMIRLTEAGIYDRPRAAAAALMCSGLAIKSALWPFHSWVPDAYSESTPTTASILSSLVSKAYIVVLLKVLIRVLGPAVMRDTAICDVCYVFGAAGMIVGSVGALGQKDLRRMTAYSSIAQIGYIYLGIGLESQAGMAAALFHLIAHTAAKSMMFLSLAPLSDAAGGRSDLDGMRGAARKAPLAGVCFTAGSLSLIGLPFLGGLAAKVFLAEAGIAGGGLRMWGLLAVLVISTALNVAYLMRAVLALWRTDAEDVQPAEGGERPRRDVRFAVAAAVSLVLNVALFFAGGLLLEALTAGVTLFT